MTSEEKPDSATCTHQWKKMLSPTKKEKALYMCRICRVLREKGKTASTRTHRGRP